MIHNEFLPSVHHDLTEPGAARCKSEDWLTEDTYDTYGHLSAWGSENAQTEALLQQLISYLVLVRCRLADRGDGQY